MTALVPALALLLAAAAPPGERIAVLAVHDAAGPDGELSELTHQLRAACVERAAGVIPATEMRARLAGKTGGATLAELDRAFGGALAVYQNGEFDSAVRTLKAIIDDLEELPESDAVWNQWTRAVMRLSHVYLSMKQQEDLEAVQIALLKIDSGHQLDPVLYAPGFRARFDELRQRVRAMPKRRLTVTARGRGGTIYVGGRDIGPTPATVILPVGAYRIAGASGNLRIPSFTVDLAAEDRAVVLDFALAEAFRPSAGPGLVLPSGDRAGAIIRTGAWLGVERLVVASRATEGDAHFLVGALYDVRRGALLREGSVRMISGGVPAVNLGALSAFLLTGQSSREVIDRSREPAAPRPTPRPPPVAAAPPPAPKVVPPAVAVAPVVAPAKPSPTATTTTTTTSAPAPAPTAQPAPASTPTATSTPPRTAAPTTAPTLTPPPPAPRPAPAPAATPPPLLALASPPDLHPAPPPPDPLVLGASPAARPGWMRPTAVGSGALSALLLGVTVQQALSARRSYADADAMVVSGVYQPGATPAGRAAVLGRADAASRNAWLAGGGAALSAGACALLTWWSREPTPPR